MERSFFILTIVFAWLLFAVSPTFADDGNYTCEIQSRVNPCDDAESKVTCNLEMMKKDGHVYLTGNITVHEEITSDDQFQLDISKVQDNGVNDPMMTCVLDPEDCIKDPDAPWHPIWEAMGISEIPIKAKVYGVEGFSFDLSKLKSLLTHENVGEYECRLMTMSKGTTTSCNQLGVVIMDDA